MESTKTHGRRLWQLAISLVIVVPAIVAGVIAGRLFSIVVADSLVVTAAISILFGAGLSSYLAWLSRITVWFKLPFILILCWLIVISFLTIIAKPSCGPDVDSTTVAIENEASTCS